MPSLTNGHVRPEWALVSVFTRARPQVLLTVMLSSLRTAKSLQLPVSLHTMLPARTNTASTVRSISAMLHYTLQPRLLPEIWHVLPLTLPPLMARPSRHQTLTQIHAIRRRLERATQERMN